MLKKILSIERVGKFVSCKPKGDVELRRLNLIYAENGRGKTTLCDILHSLQTGNADYLRGRGTLGHVGEPKVELRLEHENIRFENGEWTAIFPDTAIFDSTFVYENVHAGEFVEHDQKRNLYGVIIGAEGIALQRRVNELDKKSREAARRSRNAQKLLRAYLPEGLTERAFVELTTVDNLEQQIAAKQRELQALERASDVASKPLLERLELPTLPQGFDTILPKTIKDVEADVEARLGEHLATHTRDATHAWIWDGVRYQKDETCPFCGQETTGLPLLKAYRAYFSQAYRALKDEVIRLRRGIEQIGDRATSITLARIVEKNHALTEFWKYFVNYPEPTLSLQEITRVLSTFTAAAIALVDRKANSPLEPLTLGEDFVSARLQYKQARNGVDSYNTAVDQANTAIASKKTATKAGNKSLVRRELFNLENVKRRFEPEVDAACKEYVNANYAKIRVEKSKEKAKAALDTHSTTILPKFQIRINKLLQHFGTGFLIQNVERRYAGGRASSSYQLLINQVPIYLGDSSTPIGEPSFRNTLSAGDRSTLALAFFIAQLELNPKLEQKVIVLDDPFTSQDSSRRTCTQQLICRLTEKARQVIVLSHEASFLRQVYDAIQDSSIVKGLQFARAGPDETLVAEWDIVEATRSGYYKDYNVLQQYLNEGHGSPRSVVRTIRPLLEGYLRTLFPNAFLEKEWLGDFIRKIREADENDCLSAMKIALEDLEDLNGFSKRYHHNTNRGSADTEQIDDGELRTYVQRALDLVSAPPWVGYTSPSMTM